MLRPSASTHLEIAVVTAIHDKDARRRLVAKPNVSTCSVQVPFKPWIVVQMGEETRKKILLLSPSQV